MAVVIKSGASTDEQTIDATSKAARVTLYNAAGTALDDSVNALPVLPSHGYTVAGRYFASSFRLTGAASSPTNLLTIRTGAVNGVAIRRLAVSISVSATTAYLVQASFRFWINTGTTPSGGTAATKTPTDSSHPASAAGTVVLFPTSADATASAITHALPSGHPNIQVQHPLLITGVGQWSSNAMLIGENVRFPKILRASETALLALVGNSATHLHYTISVLWEEFAL